MNRLAWIAFALLAASAVRAQIAPAPPPPRVPIGYVEIADDPRHEPIGAYGRYLLKTREPPYVGAQAGIEEAKPLARAMNADHQLERMTAKNAADMAAAIVNANDAGVSFFLIDAPAEAFRSIAAATKGRDLLLFNIGANEDWLRRELCAPQIVHVAPSRAQLMDALNEFLVSKKWRDVLALQGPTPEDAEVTEAFAHSAKKFGARIVATQKFTPGADPREREKNNPALLSAINRDWDVTFVADSDFDFAREVPYRTVKPRPVIGAIDLEPVAWHWTWDRNGAPQVNTRVSKLAGGRHMESADWAAWMAVKMITQAALRTKGGDFHAKRDFILGAGGFDGAKGVALSVRPWDHQLRQAILLAAPFQVVANAPIEGFLHQRDTLDTLGDDEPETPCHLNR